MTADWLIHLREAGETADTEVKPNRLAPIYPSLQRGGRVRLTFGFEGDEIPNTSYITRYETVRQLLDHTNAVTWGVDADGIPWYEEDLPPTASLDSNIIKLAPESQPDFVRGMWALAVEGEDLTRFVADANLRFDLVMLAEDTEYATREELEAAIGGRD